jgi:hypothetical protein
MIPMNSSSLQRSHAANDHRSEEKATHNYIYDQMIHFIFSQKGFEIGDPCNSKQIGSNPVHFGSEDLKKLNI